MRVSIALAAFIGVASAEEDIRASVEQFVEAFEEDPKGTLDYLQDQLIEGLEGVADWREYDLKQTQTDMEIWWEQITWRANALNLQ